MKLVCPCWTNYLEFSKIILYLFKMEIFPWSERKWSMSRMFYTLKRLEIIFKEQGVLRDLSKLVSRFCT